MVHLGFAPVWSAEINLQTWTLKLGRTGVVCARVFSKSRCLTSCFVQKDKWVVEVKLWCWGISMYIEQKDTKSMLASSNSTKPQCFYKTHGNSCHFLLSRNIYSYCGWCWATQLCRIKFNTYLFCRLSVCHPDLEFRDESIFLANIRDQLFCKKGMTQSLCMLFEFHTHTSPTFLRGGFI